MLLKDILPIAVAAGLALPSAVNAQASPTLIPLQARLTDQSGEPYVDGRYTLTFNLYTEPVGGATQWTERHEQVGVVDGMINLFLGSIEPLPQVRAEDPIPDFFSTTRYLGITIDADNLPSTADPEMVPRQMIIPAFHAKTADLASDAAKLGGHGWDALFVGGFADPTSEGAVLRNALIGANSITSDNLAAGSVGSREIRDGGVDLIDIDPPKISMQDGSSGQSGAALGQVVFGPALPTTEIPGSNNNIDLLDHAIEIKTRGGPVLIALQGEAVVGEFAVQGEIELEIGREQIAPTAPVGTTWLPLGDYSRSAPDGTNSPGHLRRIPPASFRYIDVPPNAGTFKYRLRIRNRGVKLSFANGVRLVGYEIR